MGILSALGIGRRGYDATKVQAVNIGVVSPWADDSTLTPIVMADLFGREVVDAMPLSRSRAMSIPVVAKARNLLITHIARAPLVAMNADGVLADDQQPTFLYRTNGSVSPYERMAWTVDSLVFYGVALWLVQRGSVGQIIDAEWVPMSDWSIDPRSGAILVYGRSVDERQVILFNPPFEGLLNIAGRTIRGAIDTEEAWTGRMRNPVPMTELHITDDTELEQTEVDAFVLAWSKARRDPNGAVGFTPAGMELRTHGEVSADLFLEGRNAVRTDIGSFLNVRASMLDGTSSIDSLTYVTKDGERNAFFESDLPFWTDPIAQALSQDNVVPRGQRIRFDFSDELATTPSPTGATEQD